MSDAEMCPGVRREKTHLGTEWSWEARSYDMNWSERKGTDHQAEETPRDDDPGGRARCAGASSRPVPGEGHRVPDESRGEGLKGRW